MKIFISIFFIVQIIALISISYVFSKRYIRPIFYKKHNKKNYDNNLLSIEYKISNSEIEPNYDFDMNNRIDNKHAYQLKKALSEYKHECSF